LKASGGRRPSTASAATTFTPRRMEWTYASALIAATKTSG
jgi:hypothetical protein